ncbi:MAG: hypothetical protein AAF676_07180 [Pseudomonadota bacterium]
MEKPMVPTRRPSGEDYQEPSAYLNGGSHRSSIASSHASSSADDRELSSKGDMFDLPESSARSRSDGSRSSVASSHVSNPPDEEEQPSMRGMDDLQHPPAQALGGGGRPSMSSSRASNSWDEWEIAALRRLDHRPEITPEQQRGIDARLKDNEEFAKENFDAVLKKNLTGDHFGAKSFPKVGGRFKGRWFHGFGFGKKAAVGAAGVGGAAGAAVGTGAVVGGGSVAAGTASIGVTVVGTGAAAGLVGATVTTGGAGLGAMGIGGLALFGRAHARSSREFRHFDQAIRRFQHDQDACLDPIQYGRVDGVSSRQWADLLHVRSSPFGVRGKDNRQMIRATIVKQIANGASVEEAMAARDRLVSAAKGAGRGKLAIRKAIKTTAKFVDADLMLKQGRIVMDGKRHDVSVGDRPLQQMGRKARTDVNRNLDALSKGDARGFHDVGGAHISHVMAQDVHRTDMKIGGTMINRVGNESADVAARAASSAMDAAGIPKDHQAVLSTLMSQRSFGDAQETFKEKPEHAPLAGTFMGMMDKVHLNLSKKTDDAGNVVPNRYVITASETKEISAAGLLDDGGEPSGLISFNGTAGKQELSLKMDVDLTDLDDPEVTYQSGSLSYTLNEADIATVQKM